MHLGVMKVGAFNNKRIEGWQDQRLKNMDKLYFQEIYCCIFTMKDFLDY